MPEPAAAEPAFVRALCRPDAYRHPVEQVELRQTHISWVFLAGDHAYKVKKPVDFGFLDFSTLERRETDARLELELNRRLSPDIYLGLSQVVRRDDTFFFDGPGERIEPVVRMRRLPDAGMLVNLLANQAVPPALVQRIARRLVWFHARAATGAGVDEHGTRSAIRRNWQENFLQIAPFEGRTVAKTVNDAIRDYTEHYLATHRGLFDARVDEGRIRDGHGDLHASSICIEGRHIWLFDCLEFSPRYRCGDVAGEVGFLAMDLDHFGRADLATAFVDAYVAASGDEQVRELLPFYACYRAYVRGKVRSLRLTELDASGTAARIAAVEEDARSYFDLARSYTGWPAGRLLVAVMGLPASGKTTLARTLAGRLGLVHLNSDVVRKELAGSRPTEHHDDRYGEGLYTAASTRRTYAAMRRRAGRWLGRGRSVVLDATFGDVQERSALVRLARRRGVPLLLIECTAHHAELQRRLAARRAEPGRASDARLELWPRLLAGYVEPTELRERLAIDSSAPLTRQVAAVLARLAR
ncbi:MAG: AAA family ATPase [Chloroflexi bacterium]|nr:AAA family ATPase [Chloroflexota bacterium]